jgi:hypothetical protein
MTTWQDIGTAPRDGTAVRLKGRWPNTDGIVELDGFYEAGGYTEGWVDAASFNVFYPTHWMPPPSKEGE